MTVATPAVVGALKCQREPFLLEDFETNVISCVKVDSKTAKKFLIGKEATHVLELEDTILFPEGGGQPSDTGYVTLRDNETKRINVVKVVREGLHAKHYVDQAIEPGSKISLHVDKEKRLDYMQQHTGQHLLSAILDNYYDNADTLSWSMGGIPSTKKPILEPSDYLNYLELPRKLSKDEISEITDKFNEIVSTNVMPITVKETIAVEKSESIEDVSTKKIPDDYDYTLGVLRTINIGELDKNPCCGTHLTATSQVQSILILDNQSTVRGTNSRLYFMCGKRVSLYAKMLTDYISSAKVELSCSESQISSKVVALKENLQKAKKKEQYFISQIAKFEGERLYQSLEEGKQLYVLKDEFGSLDLLLAIQKEFQELCDKNSKNCELLILCGRERASLMGSVVIISPDGEKIQKTVSELQSALKNLKGGGGKNGGKWQGKIMNFTDQEYDVLEHYLEQIA